MKDLKKYSIIAIDGRSGSGKTTYAAKLQKELACFVVHVDDFYLPKEKRDLSKIAGNIDFMRLINDVLRPYRDHHEFFYEPFDCKSQTLKDKKIIVDSPYLIVEGSFSLFSLLREYYDYKIYIETLEEIRIERLKKREGERFKEFKAIWLENERRYFESEDLKKIADLVII